jgi:ribosomal protein S1
VTKREKCKNTSEKTMNQLIEEYDYKRPQRGQFIDAEITQIEHDRILLDLGAKIDAIVTPQELKKTDEEIIEDLSEGDIVPVYVLHPPNKIFKPTVSLQRGIEKLDWDQAEAVRKSKEIIKLEITGQNRGGLLVKFGNIQGFLPASLMPSGARSSKKDSWKKIKNGLIGEEIYLKIVEVKPHKKRLILSGLEDQKDIIQAVYDDISVGDIKKGIVVNLVEYGAFVFLCGAVGLLHISELEWVELDHPSDMLQVGDKIEVKILEVDVENKRISLSRKALINPFAERSLLVKQTSGQD